MTVETTIQAVLGVAPFTGTDGLTVATETRPAVRTWLQRLGWKGDTVVNLTLDELRDLYADGEKHNDIARAKGGPLLHAPAAEEAARVPYAPRNRDLLAYLERRGVAAPQPGPAPQPDMVNPMSPAPTPPEPVTPPPAQWSDQARKARAVAELLAELAGDKAAPLDEDRVIALIREHAPKANEVVHRVQIITATPAEPRMLDDKPRHKAFPEVLAAVGAGINVMLVGPAGAGKTHLADDVAKALSLGFRFTGALDSPYKLLGFIDAQGRTVRTPYRETYEHGGVFLFDEIDASTPAALLAFNAGLANGQQDFPDACIQRHPDARFIASANTYGRGQDRVYVGRNQLDAASLDRFAVIAMDYDAELETALYGASDWLRYVHKVRVAVARLNIRHVVSMRAIDQGNRLLAAGLQRDRVEALALWKGLDAATVEKIKAEAR